MNRQMIELDGFEIELGSELHCESGGDHHELADRARTDRRRLGHNVGESAGRSNHSSPSRFVKQERYDDDRDNLQHVEA
jgi:hypothetical protein